MASILHGVNALCLHEITVHKRFTIICIGGTCDLIGGVVVSFILMGASVLMQSFILHGGVVLHEIMVHKRFTILCIWQNVHDGEPHGFNPCCMVFWMPMLMLVCIGRLVCLDGLHEHGSSSYSCLITIMACLSTLT